MRKNLSALALSAALIFGAAGCSLTEPASASTPMEEDQAGFECLEHGNRICGPVTMDDALTQQAWDAFDAQGGARLVRVDPTRGFRIDLGRYSRDGLQSRDGSLILVDRTGTYFEYTVTYTD